MATDTELSKVSVKEVCKIRQPSWKSMFENNTQACLCSKLKLTVPQVSCDLNQHFKFIVQKNFLLFAII